MFKRPKILIAGSFNMDLTASCTRAPQAGETVIGKKFRTAPGGKGFNQAVQCARLGADVTMVGKVGEDDFGRALLESAKGEGIDISHVLADPDEATGIAIITLEETEQGTQNRIVVCPGANFTISAREIGWLREAVGNFDMVIMQFELPMEIVETIAEWAHEAGVPVMVNPAPAAPMSDRLLSAVTFLSPNEHEAAILTGHSISVENGIDYDDVRAVADAFRKRGVKNLIITMGGNGSIAVGESCSEAVGERGTSGIDGVSDINSVSGIHHTECVKMPHVADPTAAGDSFVASFCTVLAAGLPVDKALDFASHAAAITVTRMGAMPSLPTITEVRELLRERGYEDWDLSLPDALR